MRRHLLMRSLYALPCHRNGSLTEQAKSEVKVLEHYLEYVLSGDMKAAASRTRSLSDSLSQDMWGISTSRRILIGARGKELDRSR